MHLYASTRAKIDTRSLNTPRGRTRFSGERGGVRKRAVDVASRLWFTLSGSYHLGPAYAARLAIVRTSQRINSRLSAAVVVVRTSARLQGRASAGWILAFAGTRVRGGTDWCRRCLRRPARQALRGGCQRSLSSNLGSRLEFHRLLRCCGFGKTSFAAVGCVYRHGVHVCQVSVVGKVLHVRLKRVQKELYKTACSP